MLGAPRIDPIQGKILGKREECASSTRYRTLRKGKKFKANPLEYP